MTDDLVKRLRDMNGGWASDEALAAADRIEELEAKLEAAVKQMQRVKDFRYDPNIGVELNMLEATLAKIKGEVDE